MKNILTNLALVTLLAFAVSSFSACSGSGSAEKASSDSVPAANSGEIANKEATKKSSEYPPIPSAVAQSDLKNLDGTTFKVSDKQGKIVLLNLWATWCGPCRAEMPALVRMQDAHRDKGFEVIGLNTDDETPEQINSFAQDMNLNYTLVWADTSLQAELLKISRFDGIPQSFIVDRDGNLRAVFKGAGAADIRKMEELVGKLVIE